MSLLTLLSVLGDSLSVCRHEIYSQNWSPHHSLSCRIQAEWSKVTCTFPGLKRLRVEISGHSWVVPELCCVAVLPIGVIPGHSQDGPVMAWLETIGNLLVHRIGKRNLKKWFFFLFLRQFYFVISGWPQITGMSASASQGVGVKLTGMSASASQVRELKASTTIPSIYFCCCFLLKNWRNS